MSDNRLASNIELNKAFERDLTDPRFNRFLFFTYTFEEQKILPLIPKTAKAIIYYNIKVNDKISKKQENIEFGASENHSKIYCMWGDQHIKCWIGSFNLTESGLYRTIEWAACFEGKLQKHLEIEQIVNNKASWEISDNIVVNQLIDLVASIRNRDNPNLPDKLFNVINDELVVIHNLTSNTLRNCITKLATNAKADLAITYITPFVSSVGIETFTKLLPSNVDKKKVIFEVITRLPETGNFAFPGSKDIERFKSRFKEFKILKRKTTDSGTRLKDGTEISEHPIHLKLIHITFTNRKGEKEVHSIFTSANLTDEAWSESPRGNIEIGIWIRDIINNQKMPQFIDNFKFCFSEPDKQELLEIDSIIAEAAAENKLDEIWFENLFAKSLEQSADTLTVNWSNGLPDIEIIEALLYFKNIVTGERLTEQAIIKKQNDSFIFNFQTIKLNKNLILEFVRVTFRTNTETPLYQVKSSFIQDFSQAIDYKNYIIANLPQKNCNTVAVNDQKQSFGLEESIRIQTENRVKSLLYSNVLQEKQNITIFLDIEKQSQLDSNFFGQHEARLVTLEAIGQFFEVTLKINEFIDPPFDSIEFKDKDFKIIEPIGFLKNKNFIKYYFPPLVDFKQLSAKCISPFDKYFKDEQFIVFPQTNQFNKVQYPWRDAFSYAIEGLQSIKLPLEEFLAPSVEIKIQANQRELNKIENVLKYFAKEESFTYRQPILYEIKQPFIWKEPYSIIKYWGALETRVGPDTIYLLSKKGSFTIKERIISDFNFKDYTYRSFPFPDKEKLLLGKTISWIEINANDIEGVNGKKINYDKLELNVWRDGHLLEITELNVLQRGTFWLVPLAFSGLSKPMQLILSLKVKGADSLGFTSTFKAYNFELIKYGNGFKLRRTTISQVKSDLPIQKGIFKKEPTLEIPISEISDQKRALLDRKYRDLIIKEDNNSILRLSSNIDCLFYLKT